MHASCQLRKRSAEARGQSACRRAASTAEGQGLLGLASAQGLQARAGLSGRPREGPIMRVACWQELGNRSVEGPFLTGYQAGPDSQVEVVPAAWADSSKGPAAR